MLLGIHVKNLALIDELAIDFGEHLNILTGETGAGKSILIGSVSLALGGRVSKDMIRQGADSALVELYFRTDDRKITEMLREMDIPADDGQIIITRRIGQSRSVSRVNGEIVSARALAEISGALIDIHGQHDHQSLLHISKHLDILDDYAGGKLNSLKGEMARAWQTYLELSQELEKSASDAESRRREQAFISFEIQEIEAAQLVPGEDEALEAQYKKMVNARKISDLTGEAYHLTEDSAADAVSRALRNLYPAASYDETVSGLLSQLEDVENLLNDFNRELAGYMEGLTFDEETFDSVERRLNLLNDLKAKYGQRIESILAYREEKEARLHELLHYDEYIAGLGEKCQAAKSDYDRLAGEVSRIRRREAAVLGGQIRDALLELNFLDVQFEIQVRPATHASKNGIDEVEFMISTNPGEPLKSLAAVASGGELSRVMLAVKSVLAGADDIETLIFDEIDSGISGRTAQKVSERLAVIAASRQVICISHLPQIAAMADTHFLIEKSVADAHTATKIKKLDADGSAAELARMLGGARITGKVLESAAEMKALADKTKAALRG